MVDQVLSTARKQSAVSAYVPRKQRKERGGCSAPFLSLTLLRTPAKAMLLLLLLLPTLRMDPPNSISLSKKLSQTHSQTRPELCLLYPVKLSVETNYHSEHIALELLWFIVMWSGRAVAAPVRQQAGSSRTIRCSSPVQMSRGRITSSGFLKWTLPKPWSQPSAVTSTFLKQPLG